MSTPNLLPAQYRPWHFASSEEARAALSEPWRKELRTLAIWSHALTGTLWCLAYLVHLVTRRSLPAST